MTPIQLVDSLVEFIENVVKDFNLTTKVKGVSKVPSVYPGYLPPEEDDDEEDNLTPKDYPFIIARFLTDIDDLSSEDVTNVVLIIGTHSDDGQNGWRDTINIATRIKIELKKKINIGPFALTGKVQTTLFEDQAARPFWHAIMDLSFNIPQVQPEWGGNFE